MQAKTRFNFPMVLAVGLLLAAIVLMSNRSVQSYQGGNDAKSVKWEYTTSSVESASLQTKLDELANKRWEVISLARSDSVLGQGNDGKSHIRTSEFQVTSRRRAK